jgi:hypothetical protein
MGYSVRRRIAVPTGYFIDFFYQLNEIFDLLRHDGMRRLYALENARRVGNG